MEVPVISPVGNNPSARFDHHLQIELAFKTMIAENLGGGFDPEAIRIDP